MDKPELRQRMKAKRLELASAYTAAQEDAFTARLVEGIQKRPKGIVAGYAAFRSEIPVWKVLTSLHESGWRIALPCTRANAPLVFRAWQPGSGLTDGAHGIAEPPSENEACIPDVIIAPLLAFDRTGHRLGYGGGHYDRTLAAHPGAPYVIGAAYAGQEVDALPTEPTDIKLHAVVTERQAFFFV